MGLYLRPHVSKAECASGKNSPQPMQVTRRKRCQTRTRSRKKGCVYGARVSEATIFAYVEGNPLQYSDPDGLQRRPSGAPVIPLFPRIGPTLPPANPQVGTTRAPIEIRPGTNLLGEINGRPFSGHAFDRMQGRGLPPSAVMDALLGGRPSPGSRPNTTQHYDPVNNITVVTNSTTGNVITVRNGPPSNTCQ